MSQGSPEKAALRQRMKLGLAALAEKQRERAARAATRRTLELPELQRARVVLCCLSFGGEIDTWTLVERLLGSGRRVVVPRTVKGDPRLFLHEFPCELDTLSFGLRQPFADEPPVAAGTVDAAILLGLSFDRDGYRLGYGRGYFDRFLGAHPMTAIGLGYDLQLVDRLPRAAHDVPMSVVVTDRSTVRPSAAMP